MELEHWAGAASDWPEPDYEPAPLEPDSDPAPVNPDFWLESPAAHSEPAAYEAYEAYEESEADALRLGFLI